MKDKREKIESALLKVALGGVATEVCEEYAEVDGQLKLTKRKETKKDIPPDLKAAQLLLSVRGEGGNEAELSDEELEEERQRLLKELAAAEQRTKEGQVCDEANKPVRKRAKSRRKTTKKKTGGKKE